MDKLAIFQVLYREGDINLVVETGAEDVQVPPHLYGKLTHFIVGKIPSPTLMADENGINAALRFGTERFVCFFPWASIRAMISDEAVVSFPKEGNKDEHPESSKSHPSLKLIK